MKWINVNDSLPQSEGQYLCSCLYIDQYGELIKMFSVERYNPKNKNWSSRGLIITHWMPLPEMPEVLIKV